MYVLTLLDNNSFLCLFFVIGGVGNSVSDSEDKSWMITNLRLHVWQVKKHMKVIHSTQL